MTMLLNLLSILLIAAAIPGIINRTRARLCGRKGVTLWQHLLSVRVLFRKGAVYSPATSFLFRTAPAVYLAAMVLAALLVPVGSLRPVLAFEGDLILFVYLLALARFALILAALDTGSSFEGMGASREALYGALAEPVLLLAAATLALLTGHTSFADIFREADPSFLGATAAVILFYAMIRMCAIESGRIPVDDPRTHLELTMIHEVMVLDYCGFDLGAITLAGWLKTALLALIGADAAAVLLGSNPLAVLALVVLAAVYIGCVESLRARNKLPRNITYILTAAAIVLMAWLLAWLSDKPVLLP